MNSILGLLAVAYLLFFFEVFLPGGLFALVGIALVLGAAVVAFDDYGMTAGFSVLGLSTIIGVALFFLEIRFIQKSPIAKRLFHLEHSKGVSVEVPDAASLVGKIGETLTMLAPSGKILVEGQTYEARAASGLIEKGVRVKVVRVGTFNVEVKKVS
jgi:membrane-bound serine protease (ClpP class)